MANRTDFEQKWRCYMDRGTDPYDGTLSRALNYRSSIVSSKYLLVMVLALRVAALENIGQLPEVRVVRWIDLTKARSLRLQAVTLLSAWRLRRT